jgi:hypothetical protein
MVGTDFLEINVWCKPNYDQSREINELIALAHAGPNLSGGKQGRIVDRITDWQVSNNNKESTSHMKYALILAIGLAAGTAASFAQTGNGAPSGPHYNLNILGKEQCPTDPMTTGSGHVIFVLLNGGDAATNLTGKLASNISKVNKIYLQQAPDNTTFAVLDGNACDANGALFELPNPSAGYSIWARALGTPGGNATMTTCATDPTTGEVVCSTLNVLLTRTKGQQQFSVVTTQLTTMTFVDPTTGKTVTVSIFDPSLIDYFWNYQNNGLRLAQLRFYPLQ